jgi:hypothetical protein
MPNWPNDMPDPVWNALSISSPTGAIISTPMDTGPSKRRRRTTAVPQPVNLVFAPVTEAQFTAFETWYRGDLEMGALRFSMDHPLLGDLRQWRFAESNQYLGTPIGDDAHQLSVSLELLP